jgi:hypothetical protein
MLMALGCAPPPTPPAVAPAPVAAASVAPATVPDSPRAPLTPAALPGAVQPEAAPFDLASLLPLPWDEFVWRWIALRVGAVFWDSDHPETMENACARGAMGACHALADALYEGNGVPRDKTRAVRLYRQACAAGLKASCENLPEARARRAAEAARERAKEAGGLRKRCVDDRNVRSCEKCADLDDFPDYQFACLNTWCGKTNNPDACATLRQFIKERGAP